MKEPKNQATNDGSARALILTHSIALSWLVVHTISYYCCYYYYYKNTFYVHLGVNININDTFLLPGLLFRKRHIHTFFLSHSIYSTK